MAKRRSGQQRDDFGRFIRPGASYAPLERGPGGKFRRAGAGEQGEQGGEQGGGGRVERLDYGSGGTARTRRRAPSSTTAARDAGDAGDAATQPRSRRRPAATSGDGAAPARRTRRPAATSGDGEGAAAGGGGRGHDGRRPPRLGEAFAAGVFGRPFWKGGD